MGKIHALLTESPVLGFLVLTFVISAFSFLLMVKVPEAHTPESTTGLPIWLIAIWSPNIAAIIIWTTKNEFVSSFKLAFSFPKFSWWMLLALIPLAIAGLLLLIEVKKGNVVEWSNFKIKYLLPLIFINMFMGPLGEELGWRAFLYPVVRDKYGWIASALFVGVIWAFWHAPLWFLESPQSKIPFWAFAVIVISLSILMSMIYNHSQSSILFIVLLHFTFNISLAVIDILGTHQPGEYVVKSLYVYIPIIITLVGIHEWVSTSKYSFEAH